MPQAVVCVKPIPDPKHWDKLYLDHKTGVLRREGVPHALNPPDKHALEVALQIKDEFSWDVAVVSMSPPDTVKILRETLAMGADRVYLASDKAFSGSDTLATAYALSELIKKKIGLFDLVVCGSMSLDGSTSQVPAQLAHYLGVPHVTHVTKVETDDAKSFKVVMDFKASEMIVECKTPLVLSVTKEVNLPRIANVMGIISSENKPLEVVSATDINADLYKVGLDNSPTKVKELFIPEIKRKKEILKGGDPEDIVDELLDKLHETGVL